MKKNIIVLIVCMCSFVIHAQQKEAFLEKIWEVKEFYGETAAGKSVFYHKDSTDNINDYKGFVYQFDLNDTLRTTYNDTLTVKGEWQILTPGDSIQMNGVRFGLSVEMDEFTLKNKGTTYNVPVEYFMEFSVKADTTLSNNDLSNDEELEGVTLYPIPVNSDLNIQILDKNLNINKLTFYTLTGEEAFTKTLEDEIDDRILDVSTLNTGVYFVRFYDQNNKSLGVKKIIKL